MIETFSNEIKPDPNLASRSLPTILASLNNSETWAPNRCRLMPTLDKRDLVAIGGRPKLWTSLRAILRLIVTTTK